MLKYHPQIPLNNLQFRPTVPIAIGIVFDNGYWYGYQGQEKDNEFCGDGNIIIYKYRIQDARIGRFLSLDPLKYNFPWNSPYVFSENRVIDGLEFEGLKVVLVGGQVNSSAVVSVTGEIGLMIDKDGAIMIYGSGALGLSSSASVSAQVSVTFFPTMPSIKDALGIGYSLGVAYGEGLVGSTNFVKSGIYYGVNQTFGIGVSATPGISGQLSVSYTAAKPLNKQGKKAVISILVSGSLELNYQAIEIRSKIQGLETSSQIFESDLSDIDIQLTNTDMSKNERSNLLLKKSEIKNK